MSAFDPKAGIGFLGISYSLWLGGDSGNSVV
jgi:hypothetical protein